MASEENKQAVYHAWGLLAAMIREFDAMVSIDYSDKQFVITAMLEGKGWTDLGKGATLVEATLGAASFLGMIDNKFNQKTAVGFKAYSGVR